MRFEYPFVQDATTMAHSSGTGFAVTSKLSTDVIVIGADDGYQGKAMPLF